MFTTDHKVIKFISKYRFVIILILFTLSAVLLRIPMLDFVSDDFEVYLNDWFGSLQKHGGFQGVKSYQGNYNLPYVMIMAFLTYLPMYRLHSIKIVSIIFDFVLALSSASLVSTIVKKKKQVWFLITYGIVLFLPNVVMNSSLWGQCDSMYASFVVLSLLFLIKEKYVPSFLLLGIAFAFKLQFVFILPLYIVIYVCERKFPIYYFLILPVVNFIMCIPAILLGVPVLKCISVYWDQAGYYKNLLVANFPNVYSAISGDANVISKIGIAVTIVCCALMLGYCLYKKVKFNSEKMLFLGLWFLMMTTFLLPRMHERYLFVGEVLSVLLFIAYRKELHIAILINGIAVITYCRYLFDFNFQYMNLLSGIYGIAIVFFTIDILRLLVKENEMKRIES